MIELINHLGLDTYELEKMAFGKRMINPYLTTSEQAITFRYSGLDPSSSFKIETTPFAKSDYTAIKCDTCLDVGTVDETLGGIPTSNPEAPCPDCDDTDYVLLSPEGTPGPCMTCANKPCPDCKDGYYYPFSGPKEPCRTCHAQTAKTDTTIH